MNNEENDLFLKQMTGVTPIKKNNRLYNKKIKDKNKIIKSKTNAKNDKTIEVEKKREVKHSHFALESVNIGKNIKKNILKIDKKIDFHGRSLLEAEEIFSSTIVECFNKNKRCLLFVTGKGLFKTKDHDYDNKPKLYHGVIRAAFFNWVKSKNFSKHILSFETASIEHGGDGAFYVYLRKNKN
jgi:DNA-nicking Smr family endonuclease